MASLVYVHTGFAYLYCVVVSTAHNKWEGGKGETKYSYLVIIFKFRSGGITMGSFFQEVGKRRRGVGRIERKKTCNEKTCLCVCCMTFN